MIMSFTEEDLLLINSKNKTFLLLSPLLQPKKEKINRISFTKVKVVQAQLKREWELAGVFKIIPKWITHSRINHKEVKKKTTWCDSTVFCSLNNKPCNPNEYYDGDIWWFWGDDYCTWFNIKPFCTVRGHKQNSHINGIWFVALARLLMGM